ncbi:sce7726 family protein [Flagellimonas oceani]|nr:sce7726 family protein [Allomuricauda oceani]
MNRYDEDWFENNNSSFLEYLRYIYKILENNYQNEYVFKNSFLNEILINDIISGDSKVFSEFRIGNAVADLVLFNGTSKVFEIKTEMDSAKRLDIQLKNYRTAFNEIYLIIPESKSKEYTYLEQEIGIITYQPNDLEKFKITRKATSNETVDPNVIMEVFHTNEYKGLVLEYFGSLPRMTSFNQFEKCKELILQIPNHILNSYFISIMKRRQKQVAIAKKHYKEFNQISLALKLTTTERKELIGLLKSPIKQTPYVLSTA